ncbi:hypothetical protein EJB05_02570, partial [Eragrostis curvula]
MEDKRMQEKHLGKIWREMLVLERVESIHTPLRLEIGEQQAQKWCTGGQTPSSSTGCRFCAVEKEGRERATQEDFPRTKLNGSSSVFSPIILYVFT